MLNVVVYTTILVVLLVLIVMVVVNQRPKDVYQSKGDVSSPIVPRCLNDNQCYPGKYCVGGTCQEKRCTSSIECRTGHECIGGYCQVRYCLSNNDCSNFELCHNNVCIPRTISCRSDGDCLTFGVCRMDTCVWPNDGKSCDSRRDCNGLPCVDYKCSGVHGRYGQHCTDTSDCQKDLYCYNHRCLPITQR
jgi:hypothetical protein